MTELFRKPSLIVLFDTNVVRDFFRSRQGRDAATLERMRDRVVALTVSGAIRPVLTQPVLWELGSILDDATPGEGGREMFEKVVRFYLELTHERLMLHEPRRQRLEIETRGRLKDHQVLAPVSLAEWMKNAFSETWMQEKLAQLHSEKEKERAAEVAKRVATRAEFQKRFGDEWDKRFAEMVAPSSWVETITKNAGNEIVKFAKLHNLHRRGFPPARHARTFWYSESFYFSKARHVFIARPEKDLLSNSAIKTTPDLVDMTHLRDCAYADVMVSSDMNLLAVAREAHVETVFLTFAEFEEAIRDPTLLAN